SYAQWRKTNAPKFFFDNISGGRVAEGVSRPPVEEANRLLNGELKYFSHEYRKTGFPPVWHDGNQKHWSQISDDHVAARRSWSLPKQPPRNRRLLRREEQEPASQRHVDIKYVWEPNRFAFVYTLVRAYAI